MRSDLNGFNLVPHICRCPGTRRPPVGLYIPTLRAIRDAQILNSSTPFGSYRCNECKQIAVYTVGQILGGLTASS